MQGLSYQYDYQCIYSSVCVCVCARAREKERFSSNSVLATDYHERDSVIRQI